MAIAFDSSANAAQVNASSLTFSHTCSGSNRILFVTVESYTTDDITGVTYAGVSMTLVDKGQYPASNTRWGYLFYLIAPSTGANNVVITASGTTFIAGLSCSYTGASQTSQPDNSTKNTTSSASSLTSTLTTVADNCWTVVGNANSIGFATDMEGTGTLRQALGNGIAMGDSNGSITPAGSTSLTMDFNGTSGSQVNIMASFAPASTSAIKTINGLAKASVKTVNGLAIASVKTWNGLA